MKKLNLRIWASLYVLTIMHALTASFNEFRTPTPLEYGYAYSHYPFMRPVDDFCKCWFVDIWAAGFHRTADKTFLNKDTAKKESLAGLVFGQTSFTLAQAIPGIQNIVPLAAVALLTPTFDYRENTAFFGLNGEYQFGCENQWAVGFRARLPFRDIKTELDSCCQLEQTLNNFFQERDELVCDEICNVQFIDRAFAYRLDFLANLPLAVNSTQKFVNFADPTRGPDDVTMGGIDVTNRGVVAPVQVVFRPDGTPPPAPFSLRDTGACAPPTANCAATPVAGLPCLDANGVGPVTTPNGRAIFCASNVVNYTPLATNPAAQKTLWVVPTVATNNVGPTPVFDLVPAARAVQTRFNSTLRNGVQSVVDFLNTNSITFNTQRRIGVGDFDTELYLNYDWCTCWGAIMAQGIVGARFPTDKRISSKDVGRLLLVPAGNNRHFEVKVGGIAGWQVCDWFALKLDGYYNWALRRRENVAAPVAGATVHNIGVPVQARVSWQYFVGDVDFTFTVPCVDPYIGCNVGYQAYVKRKDDVTIKQTTVTASFNANGVVTPLTLTLDPSLLETRTKRIAHTVKAEIFHQACSWQLFAGFNHTFAGKNSPNDSDWYLGFYLYF